MEYCWIKILIDHLPEVLHTEKNINMIVFKSIAMMVTVLVSELDHRYTKYLYLYGDAADILPYGKNIII